MEFQPAAGELRAAAAETRFHNSLWVQAKLSFWTVGLQMLIGIGFALLLNMRSGMMRALRTVFLIPMVLPPIVVAIIWKVLYTPDISPAYWMAKALGWNLPVADHRSATGRCRRSSRRTRGSGFR